MSKKQVLATIDNLRLWRDGNWTPYEIKSSLLSLRIYYDQLFITSENNILETLNMNGKIKGVYKQDVLVLVFNGDLQKVRKIKFQIKSNTSQVLQQLCQHFPVAKYQSSVKKTNIKYRNIDELFQKALEKVNSESFNLHLPASYNNFVKLCLLDPDFPKIITETQQILDNFKNNKM